MKVATFNIQNIFSRHKVLLHSERSNDILKCTKDFDTLIYREEKREEDYSRMRELAEILGFKNGKETKLDPFIDYGQLIKKKEGSNVLSYDARALFERKRTTHPEYEPIDLDIVENKALAVKKIDADILVLQEVESRKALLDFNQHFLKENRNEGYKNILFMPTNDPYGRGMGILLREGYTLKSMISHVNEREVNGSPLFDKDLQEYDIGLPSGSTLKVFNAHFQSLDKDRTETGLQIMQQAKRTQGIVRGYMENDVGNIIVLGTLGAPKSSWSLSDLLSYAPLKQITMDRTFNIHQNSGPSLEEIDGELLDHMLIMRKDSDRVVSCGISKTGNNGARGILWAKLEDPVLDRRILKKIA